MNLQTQMSLVDIINAQGDSEEEETRDDYFTGAKIIIPSNSRTMQNFGNQNIYTGNEPVTYVQRSFNPSQIRYDRSSKIKYNLKRRDRKDSNELTTIGLNPDLNLTPVAGRNVLPPVHVPKMSNIGCYGREESPFLRSPYQSKFSKYSTLDRPRFRTRTRNQSVINPNTLTNFVS